LTKLDELHPLLKLTVQNLPQLTALLTKRPSLSDANNNSADSPSVFVLESSVGKIIPLGFERLKIVELISALFMTNYNCIDSELMKMNVLSTCLDLFFSYPWNNFLHAIVEAIVQGILEGENEELKIALLKDANLLQRIVDASKENEEECAKPKGIRRGYMGHITSISQSLLNIATVTPSIEKLLNEHQEWNNYAKGALTTARERENRSLAGYLPNEFSMEHHVNDFEDEYDDEDDEDG
jgi:serine/threonine-protein phosphatase 6 regulatory subunit 3